MDTIERTEKNRGLSWRRLGLLSGILTTVALALSALTLGDLEAGAVAVAMGLSTWLTRVRKGKVGTVAVVLVATVTLAFMAPAAATNLNAGSPLRATTISVALASLALLTIVSQIASRVNPQDRRGTLATAASIGLIAVSLIAFGAIRSSHDTPEPDVRLVAEQVAFSSKALRVTPGSVTVAFENRDLFWHTFTIRELGVNLWVPVGAELMTTFDAGPGVYEFICAIPGHPEAGMVGTLIVEG